MQRTEHSIFFLPPLLRLAEEDEEEEEEKIVELTSSARNCSNIMTVIHFSYFSCLRMMIQRISNWNQWCATFSNNFSFSDFFLSSFPNVALFDWRHFSVDSIWQSRNCVTWFAWRVNSFTFEATDTPSSNSLHKTLRWNRMRSDAVKLLFFFVREKISPFFVGESWNTHQDSS